MAEEIKFKKKRKPRSKNKKQYFTQDTEDAIVEYNLSEDMVARNKLYNERISYPFDKLAENILNTFKFSYFQCSHEEVQKEVVITIITSTSAVVVVVLNLIQTMVVQIVRIKFFEREQEKKRKSRESVFF